MRPLDDHAVGARFGGQIGRLTRRRGRPGHEVGVHRASAGRDGEEQVHQQHHRPTAQLHAPRDRSAVARGMARAHVALLLAAALGAQGLYEDQVNKPGGLDWYRQQIGRATQAHFHSSGQLQRLALVSTEEGVLAGLDLRTGAVIWRQVLTKGESVLLFQLHGKSVLSVSSTPNGGAMARMWTPSGGLVWDMPLPAGPSGSPAPQAVFTSSAVIISWGSDVTALHGSTGQKLWCAVSHALPPQHPGSRAPTPHTPPPSPPHPHPRPPGIGTAKMPRCSTSSRPPRRRPACSPTASRRASSSR